MPNSGRLRTDTDSKTMITSQKQRLPPNTGGIVATGSRSTTDLIPAGTAIQPPANKAFTAGPVFPVDSLPTKKCPWSAQKIINETVLATKKFLDAVIRDTPCLQRADEFISSLWADEVSFKKAKTDKVIGRGTILAFLGGNWKWETPYHW